VNLSNNAFNDVLPDWGVPTPTLLDANCDGIDDVLLWPWRGFFAPIDNQPVVNVVKAGSAIPVKFSLSGNRGLTIFAAGYPMSNQVSCGSSEADAVEETVTAGASSLSYDPVADQYVYVWKTDKSWAGTCRQFVLKLADGSTHRADFRLTK
jgi:hypothetical protein